MGVALHPSRLTAYLGMYCADAACLPDLPRYLLYVGYPGRSAHMGTMQYSTVHCQTVRAWVSSPRHQLPAGAPNTRSHIVHMCLLTRTQSVSLVVWSVSSASQGQPGAPSFQAGGPATNPLENLESRIRQGPAEQY